MISAARISVTDATTALNTPDGSGQRLRLRNTGANSIDLGPSDVVSGSGFELAADAEVDIELSPGDELFGISANSESNDVQVLVT